MSFIPLHVHSQYSILESTASIPDLIRKAQEYQLKALALTDSGNLHGAIDFYKAAKAEKIQPIIGCQLRVAPTRRSEKKKIGALPTSFPLICLAMNETGYRNLCKLSSLGYLEGFYYHPRIDKELLEKYHEGLICLEGGIYSKISYLITSLSQEEVDKEISWYVSLFGDRFYLELQRSGMKPSDIEQDKMEKEPWVIQKLESFISREKQLEAALLELSSKKQISYVATQEIRYIDRLDWKAHEILLNIQSGEVCEYWEKDSQGRNKAKIPNPKRKSFASHEYYFKSPTDVSMLFGDLPLALDRSLEIAKRCQIELDFNSKHYPVFSLPVEFAPKEGNDEQQRLKQVSLFLRHLCEEGVKRRYTPERLAHIEKQYEGKDPLKVVSDRLEYELAILSSKEMCDYILIVYDFIAWAKRRKIPMGPGRGSAAGSLVAYLIGITDIEPLRFGLFFERFINPERVSYPDIDVDICMERRQEVIDYTVEKYGKEKVAQIITFGKMKAKMAIKDVGRVLNVALTKVNEIAKLVPEDVDMTLEKAFEIDPDLQRFCDQDAEAKDLLDKARKIEGSIRNTGIHAAGLIISKDSLTEHIPVCNAKDTDMVVTQYAMKPVEMVGMLKIDFLGLKTLTSIQKTVDGLAKEGIVVDWSELPLDDQATFNLLNQGRTSGVFQLESAGMQDLARRLHIDRFEEIIAVGALYRPGPMDMIPSFIQRKHGKEEIEFDHPMMEDILAETYGVMVYQEQVMMIASKLAGYSLGEGDVLRRAMGKKDHKEMSKQREKFLQGAALKGISEGVASAIFGKIEKFASYGFNKSHAAAYAYLSYATAYLKANYPVHWMAALMTCDKDDLGKITKFIRECQTLGIAVLPPDVNESDREFRACKGGIRFAMTGVKGVGEASVDATVEEREKQGAYSSLYDYIQRVDKRRVARKNIENLILAGAFDFTGWTREAMLLSLGPMYDHAVNEQKERLAGVLNFLGLFENEDERFAHPPLIETEMDPLEKLHKEKELLGFYLTGHPLKLHQSVIEELNCLSVHQLHELDDGKVVRLACLIEDVQIRISSKTQKKFAILTVGDGWERSELPVWPELFEKTAALLTENRPLFVLCRLEKTEEGFRLQALYIEELTAAKEEEIRPVEEYAVRQRKKQALADKKQLVEKMESKKLILKLNADQMRLSHVLGLKKIFRDFHGTSSVDLHFFSGTEKVGQIEIGSLWGVTVDPHLEGCLKKIPQVLDLKIES